MKLLHSCILVLLVALFLSCHKKDYPQDNIDTNAIFYFKGTVSNSPVSLSAGLNKYFMYSGIAHDSNNVFNFTADLKTLNCSNCPNSIRIQVNDSRSSGPSDPIKLDSAFLTGTRQFASTPDISYDVLFQPVYNKTAATYLWDFGDGTTSTASDPLHHYSTNGQYNVCLNITSVNGCVGSICNTQKIGLPGTPCKTAIVVTSRAGNSIAFSQNSSGQGQLQYLWTFGDNTTDTSPNPTHNYSVPGSYPVTLRVTDASNNVAFANYNTLTQNDASSCATNYVVSSITPISSFDPSNFSKIIITWIDANGNSYSSFNAKQNNGDYFQLVSVDDYQVNEKGQKTKKLHVKFKCELANGSNTITIDNAEAVICVAYQ